MADTLHESCYAVDDCYVDASAAIVQIGAQDIFSVDAKSGLVMMVLARENVHCKGVLGAGVLQAAVGNTVPNRDCRNYVDCLVLCVHLQSIQKTGQAGNSNVNVIVC